MNPLGLSVVFVVGSIFLSFVKHIVFPSTQSINSVIKFNKVFQLTNNKIEVQNKHYKSLYQAFHKSQLYDIQKFTNLLPNKQRFNQNILSNSLRNEEKSLLCGSDYLLLISSSISTDSYGYTQLLNTIFIYKIPLMTKLHEIKARSRLNLPSQCKKGSDIDSYHVIITNIQEIIQIIVTDDKVSSRKIKQYKSSFKLLDKFDYDKGWIAYNNKQQPWVVQLINFSQPQQSNNRQSIQINLIKIQMKENKGQYQYEPDRHLKIRDIFIAKQNKSQKISEKNSLLITAVYQYYENGDAIKKIKMITFKFSQNNFTKIKNFQVDFGHYILNRVITQCSQYLNIKTGGFDVSCLITKYGQSQVKFINFMDIYKQDEVKNHSESTNLTEKVEISQGKASQTHELLETNQTLQIQQEGEYEGQYFKTQDQDYDLLWMLQAISPVGSNSQSVPQQKQRVKDIKITLKFLSNGRLHLLKPSIPDPIIFYQQKGIYYLFSFNLLNQIYSQDEQVEIPSLNFKLDRPASFRMQEKQLRNVGWIQEENLIVVLWGAGVEVYQYSSVEFQHTGDGIAMSVIIPFIQLFATVFCLLRIVWSTE